jgi:glutamate--cysteine ligase
LSVKEQLKSYILSKNISNEERKLGIEVECFIFDKNDNRIPVNKGSSFSASELLKELESSSNGNYSLEPGGQIEWSSPPSYQLKDLERYLLEYKKSLDRILNREGLKSLYMGVDPFNNPSEIDLIDQKKYLLMNDNMEKKGSLGKWMMRNTCSIQINYDIIDEPDLEELTFILDCLHPITSYLFSNSPFIEKKPNGNLNLRNHIWENTDSDRCRSLIEHGIFKRKDLLDLYLKFALQVPSIFKLDNNLDIQKSQSSLGDDLKSRLDKGLLRPEDIQAALHQIFTNVRLKNLIEVRDIDCLPFEHIMAPVAFVTGLIINKKIRKELLITFENWSPKDRLFWNELGSSLDGSLMGPNKKTFLQWIDFVGQLSLKGLKSRNLGEEKYFSEFFDDIKSKGPISKQIQDSFTSSSQSLNKFIFR